MLGDDVPRVPGDHHQRRLRRGFPSTPTKVLCESVIPVLDTRTGFAQARDAMRRGFAIRPVTFADASPSWSIRNGALQHRSGGFFALGGVLDPRSGAEHLMLFQPQGAVNGLAAATIDGERCFLLHARAEPGNVGEVQFGPSLQSTPANWMQVHGGAPAPYGALFLEHAPHARNLAETVQLDLGMRYVQKTKRVAICEVAADAPTHPGFHWTSARAVIEALAEDYCFNTDLRAAIAVAPWSVDPDAGELCPRSDAVRRSLAAPIRPDRLGQVVSHLQAGERVRLQPVPLHDMRGWAVGDDGIEPRAPNGGVAVRLYTVEAPSREVSSWVQPLVSAGGEGYSALACRERDGILEVWAALRDEIGLVNGVALGPSVLAYPGDTVATTEWLGDAETWVETRESDEGGRFFHHGGRSALIRVAAGAEPPNGAAGAWLRVSELKHMLGLSLMCTLQLRTLSSLLLCAR